MDAVHVARVTGRARRRRRRALRRRWGIDRHVHHESTPGSGAIFVAREYVAHMDLVDEDTHRLLAYVDAVRSRGHRLTRAEFNEFANRPYRRQRTTGLVTIARMQSDITERVSWREPANAWFERLGWLTNDSQDGDGVMLTSLGMALLRHLEAPSPVAPEDSAIEIFLDPDDPMSYVRLIGTLSSLGEGVLLIDPYFRFAQLEDVMGSSVSRILTSRKIGAKSVAQLELALGVLPTDERPEIRVVADLHDRFAISDEGRVVALGSSIGSSRKNIGAVVEFHDEAGHAIRVAHETLWSDATVLTPKATDTEDVNQGGGKSDGATTGMPSGAGVADERDQP
jgi:hypothetical protein